MVLLSYVRRLAEQLGVYWLVPDSDPAVGALRTLPPLCKLPPLAIPPRPGRPSLPFFSS